MMYDFSTLYEVGAVAAADPLNFDNYAESDIFSEMSSIKGGGVTKIGTRAFLAVRTEVDAER